MKVKIARTLNIAGIMGLLVLSLNLIIPACMSYITHRPVIFFSRAWEMPYEVTVFALALLLGIYSLIYSCKQR